MEKMTQKKLDEMLRTQYTKSIADLLREDEEVLVVGANKLAFPVVDAQGNERFIEITIKVPTGSREDGEAYDGYAMAEDYQMKLDEKAEKAKANAEKKAAKIAKDEAARAAKKAAKEAKANK